MTENRTSYGKLLALLAEASKQYMDYIGYLETSLNIAHEDARDADENAAQLRKKLEAQERLTQSYKNSYVTLHNKLLPDEEIKFEDLDL